MILFRRSKILFFLFMMFECNAVRSNQPSSTIDYCATISFDMGNFDKNILRHYSDQSDCRQHPIPLQLKTKKGILKARIDFRLASYGGFPIPFKRSNGSDSYVVDDKALAKNIREWIGHNKMNLNEMTYKIDFYSMEKPTGTILISKINFYRKNGGRGPVVADYYFFKEDSYAALYTSGFVSPENENAQVMMKEIERLFSSMKIEW